MSARCVGCGDCCDPVTIDVDTLDSVLRPEAAGPDADFIKEHWRKVGQYESVYEVQCDMFDRESRTCTAYENRPPVCSGYPWYGREPDGDLVLNANCSYFWDLPEDMRGSALYKLIPLTPAGVL
jgi:Fe-S-cluster containining protein